MREMLFAAPPIARLTDFVGLWYLEPQAALSLSAMARMIAHADHVAMSRSQAMRSSMELVSGRGDRRVAVIKILGQMWKPQSWWGTSTIQTRLDIQRAVDDKSVSGILLAIDSPGGAVAGTYDLAREVREARKKKPVFAHIDDLGASAAYYVASQADQVWANSPDAEVGSIGTFASITDLSKAAEKDGVRVLTFRTGPLKGIGAVAGDTITEEQAAHWQARVEDSQKHFDDAVRSGRLLNADQMKEVRTGAIFSAVRAKELKLIDGIRPYEQTLAKLADAK